MPVVRSVCLFNIFLFLFLIKSEVRFCFIVARNNLITHTAYYRMNDVTIIYRILNQYTYLRISYLQYRAVAAYLKVVRRRKPSSAEGMRGGRAREGGSFPLSLGGFGGPPPRIFFFEF